MGEADYVVGSFLFFIFEGSGDPCSCDGLGGSDVVLGQGGGGSGLCRGLTGGGDAVWG